MALIVWGDQSSTDTDWHWPDFENYGLTQLKRLARTVPNWVQQFGSVSLCWSSGEQQIASLWGKMWVWNADISVVPTHLTDFYHFFSPNTPIILSILWVWWSRFFIFVCPNGEESNGLYGVSSGIMFFFDDIDWLWMMQLLYWPAD